jgi:hypothetical protein
MAFQMKPEYWYVILGGVSMIALAHYIPALKNLNSLENVNGIDLVSLNICRQNGLM